jgi:hypothetical protein
MLWAATTPARADEELGLHLHNWLEAHVLRREAEALLSPRQAAAPVVAGSSPAALANPDYVPCDIAGA